MPGIARVVEAPRRLPGWREDPQGGHSWGLVSKPNSVAELAESTGHSDNVQDRPREASGRPEGLDRRERQDACCVKGSGCGAGRKPAVEARCLILPPAA